VDELSEPVEIPLRAIADIDSVQRATTKAGVNQALVDHIRQGVESL
jgi:hypothetical protein